MRVYKKTQDDRTDKPCHCGYPEGVELVFNIDLAARSCVTGQCSVS